MRSEIILVPAYGRIYPDVTAALFDWGCGKDFRILGTGTYCSIRDCKLLAEDYANVFLMLANLEKSIRIEV